MTVSGINERLVFFPSGVTSLAGILTVPAQPNGRTVLIPWGGGAFPSSARNRLRARLARTLAQEGFHSFRFDYPGVGESDGEYRRGSVQRPYTEEIIDAYAWLTTQGLARVSIVANCLGAWSSLMAAQQIPSLEALALVNTPVGRDHTQVRASQRSWRWWVQGIRRLRLSNLRSGSKRARYRKLIAAKASSLGGRRGTDLRFTKSVEGVLQREVSILFMYGPDGFRRDFDTALENGLRETIDGTHFLTRLILTEDRLEGFATLAIQDLFVKEVASWLIELGDVVSLPGEPRR